MIISLITNKAAKQHIAAGQAIDAFRTYRVLLQSSDIRIRMQVHTYWYCTATGLLHMSQIPPRQLFGLHLPTSRPPAYQIFR